MTTLFVTVPTSRPLTERPRPNAADLALATDGQAARDPEQGLVVLS